MESIRLNGKILTLLCSGNAQGSRGVTNSGCLNRPKERSGPLAFVGANLFKMERTHGYNGKGTYAILNEGIPTTPGLRSSLKTSRNMQGKLVMCSQFALPLEIL